MITSRIRLGIDMSAIPSIVPVSELRQNASELIKELSKNTEPIVITQRGHARAVLQDIEIYQQIQRKLEIAELLSRGEAEIEAGVGTPASDVIATARQQVKDAAA